MTTFEPCMKKEYLEEFRFLNNNCMTLIKNSILKYCKKCIIHKHKRPIKKKLLNTTGVNKTAR